MPGRIEDILDGFDRENRDEEAENARLEALNRTNPAEVCAIKGHSFVYIEAPYRRVCRWCGAEFSAAP